jgi:hypothetical protein
MSRTCSLTTLRSFHRRLAVSRVRQPLFIRPFSSSPSAQAHQGYGDGKGDPRGENPQEQGSSNAIKHQAEHPGPEPPSEGQGTGGGPTKGGSGSCKTPEEASAQSGGSRSKKEEEAGSSPTGDSVTQSGGQNNHSGKTKNGASPKISNHEAGDGNSAEKQAEVEKHNREFEEGHS